MALALEHDEPGVRDDLDLLLEQVEVCKWISIAAQEQGRALDLGPVRGAQLVFEAGPVEWIGEEDERAEVRFDRRHARDPPAKRLTTTDDIVAASRRLDEDGHRLLRTTTRKIHRESIDSATFETDDVWLHRRCITRSTVAEDDSHRAYRRSLRDVNDGRVMSCRRRVDGPLMLIINTISSRSRQKFPQPREKNLARGIDASGLHRVSQQLVWRCCSWLPPQRQRTRREDADHFRQPPTSRSSHQ